MRILAAPTFASRVRAVAPDPLLVMRLGLFIVCLGAMARTEADPDLWGHVRFGADIVAARNVPRLDAYSFTSDRPWVNHEWLAEVLMFGAYRALGASGLILLKTVLVLALFVMVIRQVRPLEHVIVRDRFTVLLAIALLPRVLPVRPQIFSLVLFCALLALVTAADRGRWRTLVAVPVLMVFWVNLHGGWLVGLGVLGVWVTCTFGSRGRSRRQRAILLAVGAASVAATLVNPYGPGLWRFLYETVGFGRADVSDWQPIYRLPVITAASWLLVAVVAVVVTVRARATARPASVAITALLLIGSFRVSRLDAFFAIAVVMLLAPMLAPRQGTAEVRATAPRPFHRLGRTRFVAAGAAAIALALVPLALGVGREAGCIGMSRAFMPEPDAARFVLANHLTGRMVTWFDWGEYAIWYFSPSIQVSLDGRRETVYTDATIAANRGFFFARDGAALGYPDRVKADYVWLPNALQAAAGLNHAGWVRIFRGPVSSIFARRAATYYVQPARSLGPACYPGP
jgi:hypothetical protein